MLGIDESTWTPKVSWIIILPTISLNPADIFQVDDMFLDTDIYSPNGTKYQVTTDDLDEHVQWMADINSRLTIGSNYFIEIGHNGNGNIEVSFPFYSSAG